jgi:hypothetical protein
MKCKGDLKYDYCGCLVNKEFNVVVEYCRTHRPKVQRAPRERERERERANARIDIDCIYYRSSLDGGYEHWCITHWRRCRVVGCPDWCAKIKEEDLRK